MSMFSIDLSWTRENEFIYDKFSRRHTIDFGGHQTLQNSSAPEYMGDSDTSNPEEIFAGALSSCHMLTFLAIAAKMGFIVDRYNDHAIAFLDKNEEGRIAVTRVDLKPEITFSGEKIPTADQLRSLHEKAHKNCFIANSVKTKVNIL